MTTNKTRPLTVVTRRAARIAASTLPTPDSAAFITTPPGPPTPLVRNTRSLRSLPVSTTQTSQRSLSGSTNPSPVRTAPIINNNNKRTAESSLPIRPRPPPPKPSPTLELNTLADIDDFLRQYARGLPCSARRIALLNLDLSHGHSIIQNPYTNLRFIEHRMLVGSWVFLQQLRLRISESSLQWFPNLHYYFDEHPSIKTLAITFSKGAPLSYNTGVNMALMSLSIRNLRCLEVDCTEVAADNEYMGLSVFLKVLIYRMGSLEKFTWNMTESHAKHYVDLIDMVNRKSDGIGATLLRWQGKNDRRDIYTVTENSPEQPVVNNTFTRRFIPRHMTQIRIDNVNYVHPCIQPIFRHIKLGFPTLNSLHLGFAYLKLGDLLPIVNLLFNPNRLQVLTITISKLSQSTTTDPEEFIHVFKASLSPTKLPLQTLTFAIRNYDDIPKPYMNALSNIVMRSLRVFRGLVNLHLSHPPAFNHPNEFLDLLHPCAQTLEKFECNDEYAMSLFTFLKTHEVTGSSMNLFGPLWATAPMNEFTALLLKAHATLPFLHVVLDPRVDAGVIIRGIGEGVEVNREVETLWVDAGGGWGMGGRDGFWDLLIKLIEKKLRGVRRLVVASEDRSVAEEHLKKFLELEIEVSFVC